MYMVESLRSIKSRFTDSQLEKFESDFIDYLYSEDKEPINEKKSKLYFAYFYSKQCDRFAYPQLLNYFIQSFYKLDYHTFVLSFESIDDMLNLIGKNKEKIEEEETDIFQTAIDMLNEKYKNNKTNLKNTKLYKKLLKEFYDNDKSQIRKIGYPIIRNIK